MRATGCRSEKLNVEKDEILDPEALQEVDPEEEFEGYTGNAGMTLDAGIGMPRSSSGPSGGISRSSAIATAGTPCPC